MISRVPDPELAHSRPPAPAWPRLLVSAAAAASIGGFSLVSWLLPALAPLPPAREAGLVGVFVAFGLSGFALGAVAARPARGAGLALVATVGAVAVAVAVVTAPAWAAGLPGGELAALAAFQRAFVAAVFGGPLSALCAVAGSAGAAR